jgi:hypothetical protein
MKTMVLGTILLLFLASAPTLDAATCSCVAPDNSCAVMVNTCTYGCGAWCLSGGQCWWECYDAPEKPTRPDQNCPVVIPLASNRQVRFTDLAGGVLFDIDADGDQDKISWTDPSSTTVFLALDRNGDGAVTDGSELFGNWTEQPPSAEPNGFLALAELDTVSKGGNGDGVISNLDAVFTNLRLWHDSNHDGLSQPEELRSLSQSGLLEIELRYHESQRRDRFGNVLRYQANVALAGGKTTAVDVFFLGE